MHFGDKNLAEVLKVDKAPATAPVTENNKIDEKNISDVAKDMTTTAADVTENNKSIVKEPKPLPDMDGVFGKQEPKKSRIKPKQLTSTED